MNDEIKLMLNIIKDVSEHKEGSRNGLMILSCKDYKTLYDYITNLQEDVRTGQEIIGELQQENERLKEENNNKAMNDYAHAIDESWYRELYDDYKSRCEKAIEYVNNNIQYDDNWVMTNDLLNILQGSDEM